VPAALALATVLIAKTAASAGRLAQLGAVELESIRKHQRQLSVLAASGEDATLWRAFLQFSDRHFAVRVPTAQKRLDAGVSETRLATAC